MRKERKHYTAEEKVAILRRHLLDRGSSLNGEIFYSLKEAQILIEQW